MELPDLSGRTILVTGATSGVGRDGAVRLGGQGARVLVHGRDHERGAATVDAIEDAGGVATFYPADFTDLDAVRGLADTVREETDGLDVLCNNAGVYTTYRGRTEQGFGMIFGVNHVAPFVLTHGLADHLTADARVVNTASIAHRFADLDLGMVRRKRGLTGPAFERYCESKLCNVLFTRELARRLGPASTNCLHPGNIPGSNFAREIPFPLSLGVDALSALPSIPGLTDTVADGGQALARLAAAEDVAGVTGEYFDKQALADPARSAKNDTLARDLWDLTAELVGIDPELPSGPATRETNSDGRASRGVRIDVTEVGSDGESADATAENGTDEADLTTLDGVGPATAEALRAAGFDSVTAVRAASAEELTTTDGVGPARARRIKDSAEGA